MPLDPETRDVLRKAKGLVAQGWWNGEKGTSRGGNCVVTAVQQVSQSFLPPAIRTLKEALGAHTVFDVFRWNDAPGRTQEEVVALFDKVLADNPKETSEATADAVAVCAAA